MRRFPVEVCMLRGGVMPAGQNHLDNKSLINISIVIVLCEPAGWVMEGQRGALSSADRDNGALQSMYNKRVPLFAKSNIKENHSRVKHIYCIKDRIKLLLVLRRKHQIKLHNNLAQLSKEKYRYKSSIRAGHFMNRNELIVFDI